jgi:DNA-directed RNA polymerase subunit RPC12/RpoP
MSTICKTCGATVSDDETRCPYCDSIIEKPIKQQPERLTSEYSYAPHNPNTVENLHIDTSTTSTNEIKGGKFWGLVILSFIFPIIGWILYFVYKNDDHYAAKAFSTWAWFGLALRLLIKYIL